MARDASDRTRSASSGWMTLMIVRVPLPTKSTAGYPEIRSISSLMSSIAYSRSQAER